MKKMRSLSLARASMTLVALFCFLMGTNAQKALPYEYGFENYILWDQMEASLNEEGWTLEVSGGNVTLRYMWNAHSGDYSFKFGAVDAYNVTQYLISPELGLITGKAVSFWYKANASLSFQVGYSTTTNDVSDFTWGGWVTASDTYQKYTDNFPAGTKYVAVKYVSSSSDADNYLFLDDFAFEPNFWGVWLETSANTLDFRNVLRNQLGLTYSEATALAASAPCYVLLYDAQEKAEDMAWLLNKNGGTAYALDMRENSFFDGISYTQTSDKKVTSASYTKTLGSARTNKHQAWMLPFDYTITSADEDFFKFYKINMIANAPNPGVDASDDMWVFLKSLKAGDVLHANMPYVYKPKVDVDEYVFTTEGATLKAKATGVLLKTETAEDVYSFYATYTRTTATTDAPFYYVGIDGSISYGDKVTVGPYRWIICKTSKFGGNTSAYSRVMRFIEDGDETTEIESVESSAMSIGSDEWYSISGVKLEGVPTEPGLYIVNGKKVLIK